MIKIFFILLILNSYLYAQDPCERDALQGIPTPEDDLPTSMMVQNCGFVAVDEGNDDAACNCISRVNGIHPQSLSAIEGINQGFARRISDIFLDRIERNLRSITNEVLALSINTETSESSQVTGESCQISRLNTIDQNCSQPGTVLSLLKQSDPNIMNRQISEMENLARNLLDQPNNIPEETPCGLPGNMLAQVNWNKSQLQMVSWLNLLNDNRQNYDAFIENGNIAFLGVASTDLSSTAYSNPVLRDLLTDREALRNLMVNTTFPITIAQVETFTNDRVNIDKVVDKLKERCDATYAAMESILCSNASSQFPFRNMENSFEMLSIDVESTEPEDIAGSNQIVQRFCAARDAQGDSGRSSYEDVERILNDNLPPFQSATNLSLNSDIRDRARDAAVPICAALPELAQNMEMECAREPITEACQYLVIFRSQFESDEAMQNYIEGIRGSQAPGVQGAANSDTSARLAGTATSSDRNSRNQAGNTNRRGNQTPLIGTTVTGGVRDQTLLNAFLGVREEAPADAQVSADSANSATRTTSSGGAAGAGLTRAEMATGSDRNEASRTASVRQRERRERSAQSNRSVSIPPLPPARTSMTPEARSSYDDRLNAMSDRLDRAYGEMDRTARIRTRNGSSAGAVAPRNSSASNSGADASISMVPGLPASDGDDMANALASAFDDLGQVSSFSNPTSEAQGPVSTFDAGRSGSNVRRAASMRPAVATSVSLPASAGVAGFYTNETEMPMFELDENTAQRLDLLSPEEFLEGNRTENGAVLQDLFSKMQAGESFVLRKGDLNEFRVVLYPTPDGGYRVVAPVGAPTRNDEYTEFFRKVQEAFLPDRMLNIKALSAALKPSDSAIAGGP